MYMAIIPSYLVIFVDHEDFRTQLIVSKDDLEALVRTLVRNDIVSITITKQPFV